MSERRAVVLLSGGLDSATTLAIAQADGNECHAVSFDYGQRHKHELRCAERLAAAAGVRHSVLRLDMSPIGGSALTSDLEVPKGRTEDEMSEEIPVTYVPARNTIFLSYALGLAEVLDASSIYIGVNAVDYSGYPDCRPEFIRAFETVANLATKAGVEGHALEVRTPLIDLTKAQIIGRGLQLGVDYSTTSTCYDPDAEGRACGACDACVLRLRGFEEAGDSDPIEYQ
jgi:7-cyano-7-deazaguanine synthase